MFRDKGKPTLEKQSLGEEPRVLNYENLTLFLDFQLESSFISYRPAPSLVDTKLH
jgi:hypothetical protein